MHTLVGLVQQCVKIPISMQRQTPLSSLEMVILHSHSHFSDHHCLISFNSQGARRTSGGNEGIATAKIRRIKTAEGSGRERGRGSRANAMTRTTGTKQSTGIAEATTRTCSHLQTASCSSAPDNIQHPNPTLIVILISKSSSSNPLPLNLTHCSSSSSPLCRGCCCYLYDLTMTFMHKRDWAHSATRLGPLLTL